MEVRDEKGKEGKGGYDLYLRYEASLPFYPAQLLVKSSKGAEPGCKEQRMKGT